MAMTDFSFYAGLAFLVVSLLFWSRGKHGHAFVVLMLSVGCIGFHSITLYDFLFWWDERYHALVAQNTLEHPFTPTLYKEAVFDMDYSAWYNAHVWLHKQPAFTWQMALCMWIFGKSIIAMRLSSVFMLLLLVFSVYKGTKKINPKLAYPLAVLVGLEPTLYNLLSGHQGMDHNDMAFMAWVAFSYFGFIKMLTEPRLWSGWWILIIGVSFAVLTKWLPGLLVFGSWGLYLIHQKNRNWRDWGNLGLAILVVSLLVGSWQLYTFQHFGDLAKAEWAYNGKHFFNVVENHGGPWYYHLHIWGESITALSICGVFALLVFLIFQRSNSLAFAFFGGVVAVFTFFSLAQTKLPNYTFLAIGPLALAIGATFKDARSEDKAIKAVYVSFILIPLCLFLNRYNSVYQDPYYTQLEQEKAFYSELAPSLPEKAVLINTPNAHQVQIMFYTDRLAYDFIPDEEQLKKAIEMGYTPIFLTHEEEPVPAHVADKYQTISVDTYTPLHP
jgi:4-amino-4-deoxy-L-arabinose transferase